MAYSKVPKACRDYAVGWETINQLRDNLDSVKDVYATQHGTTEFFTGTGSIVGFGQNAQRSPGFGIGEHDTVLVPRTVLNVRAQTIAGGGNSPQVLVHTDHGGLWISSVVRLAEGVYVLGYYGRSTTAYAEAQPHASTTAMRLATARVLLNYSATDFVVVYLQLYELVAGTFEFADYDCSVAVFSA